MTFIQKHEPIDKLTDLLCALSLIGVWPRFIESQRLLLDTHYIELEGLGEAFHGLKILHLSDLHINARMSARQIYKLEKYVCEQEADLILFTGDFLCYSYCFDWNCLEKILRSWKARLGVFAVLGNHDYETYITLKNHQPQKCPNPKPFLFRALSKLLASPPKNIALSTSRPLEVHSKLLELLERVNITLLDDKEKVLTINHQELKLIGLHDIWARGLNLRAIEKLIPNADLCPKIVLVHNPQAWEVLKQKKNQLILSGHTHGGNVKLPWIQRKLQNVNCPKLLSGWNHENSNQIHISRGISNPYPFRMLSPPHISLIHLKSAKAERTTFACQNN